MMDEKNRDGKFNFLYQKDFNLTIFLGIILLLATILRGYNLSAESYWVDEIYTITEARQSILQLLDSGRLDQPPAYYIPFHLWVRVFGDVEGSTRWFSALAGIGSVLIIYLIGKELFGKELGLLSAFFMSISSFQITYSQEARFYTFFEFTTLLSFYFYILALSKNRVGDMILYCVTSIVMFYSHTYGIFILIAQAFFFLLQIKKYKRILPAWISWQALFFVAILPYLYQLFVQSGGVGETVSSNVTGVSAPSLLDPLRTIYRFMMPVRGDRSWAAMLVSYVIAGLTLVVGVWVYNVRRNRKLNDVVGMVLAETKDVQDLKGKALLLFSWLLIPIVLPFAVSFVAAPIYRDRYLICAAPALYLILASILYAFRRIVPLALSAGVFAIITVFGLQNYYATDDHQQWREAALYVEQNARQGDFLVFAGGMDTGIEKKAFTWYLHEPRQSCSLGNELDSFSAKSDAFEQCVLGYERFWVIIRNSTEPDDPQDTYRSFFLNLDENGFQLLEEQHFIDISIYLFEIVLR